MAEEIKSPKKYLKTVGKCAAYLAIFVCFLLLGINLALQYLLPRDYVKSRIINILAEHTKMNVNIDYLQASFFGFNIAGITLADDTAPLLNIESARAIISPLALLIGRISVVAVFADGVSVQILRSDDGTFNFDKIIAGAQQPAKPAAQEKPASLGPPPVKLNIRHFQMGNSVVSFLDKKEQIDVTAENLFLDLSDFSFDKPFRISFNGAVSASIAGKKYVSTLPLGLTLHVNLNNFKLDRAFVDIGMFVARVADTNLIVDGKIENFNTTDINLNIRVNQISAKTFLPLELPDFEIPFIKVSAKIKADIAAETAKINSLVISFLSSQINARGNIAGFSPEAQYDIEADAEISLDAVGAAAPLTARFKPAGKLLSRLNISNGDVKGFVSIEEGGAHIPDAGVLNDLSLKLEIASLKDIKIPGIEAKLNGHPFEAGVSFLNKTTHADLDLFFKADMLLAKMTPKELSEPAAEENLEQPVKENSLLAELPSQMPLGLPPFNIQADVSIKKLDSHFISGHNISLKSNIKGVTPDLKEAQGIFALSAHNGRIKDLYRLTSANAVTKVLFVSLTVVSKIINTLDVLSVLKAIGRAATGGKKDDTTADDDTGGKIGAVIDYDSFITKVDFAKGISTIKQADFASDRFSFAVSGDINFNNQKLDMTVKAAPGNVSASGIMPLTLKIGGTLEEPKGSMSILSSAASLVGDTLLNNPASNVVKKIFSGIGHFLGIGKKKDEEPDVYIPLELEPQSAE